MALICEAESNNARMVCHVPARSRTCTEAVLNTTELDLEIGGAADAQTDAPERGVLSLLCVSSDDL